MESSQRRCVDRNSKATCKGARSGKAVRAGSNLSASSCSEGLQFCESGKICTFYFPWWTISADLVFVFISLFNLKIRELETL